MTGQEGIKCTKSSPTRCKIFNENTSEIAAECLKMFEVSDVSAAVACTRKDRFVNRYALNSSVVCEICFMCIVKFLFSFSIQRYIYTYVLCATDFGE